MSKDVRQFVRRLKRSGLNVLQTRNQHYVVVNKDGERLHTFGGTPSDHRWMKNAISELRKRGIEL